MRLVIFIAVILPLQNLAWNESDDEVIDAVVDQDVELPCNVTAEVEGDKFQILAWYGDGSATAFFSWDLRFNGSNIKQPSSGDSSERYHLISREEDGMVNLLIRGVRPADAGRYRCMADFASSPSINTYMQLNVIEPTERLWVIYENGTQVTRTTAGSNASEDIGPYYVGDWVNLHCVAFGGKPLPNMTWWAAQQKLKDSTTPLSDQRIRSDLVHGPLSREDHGLVLSCIASNNNVTLPLAIDVIVNMFLPPELVSIRDLNTSADGSVSAGRVHAGDTLHLQCRVLGALPPPDVQWRINNEALELVQNVAREPAQRLVSSEVKLAITPDHDEAMVTCCAPSNEREGDAVRCAQAMPLTVLYKPVLQIVVESGMENQTVRVVKGSDLTLNCSYQANPPIYEITWFREEDIVSSEEDGEFTMHPILELNNVSESNAGEYVCAASNEVGSTYSEPIVLDVTYSPFCIDPSIAEYGLAEGEAINITCNMKSNPAPEMYRWVFVDEEIDIENYTPAQSHSTNETTTPIIEFQRPNGTTFNTIFCWGVNGVAQAGLPLTPCTFLVTDETVPHPPGACAALQSAGDITIECIEGHNGGLPQKFKFSVIALDSNDELMSIVAPEPKFIIQEPKEENYKFVVTAINSKGVSKTVEIDKDTIAHEIIDEKSAVKNITTLALSLCGGVLLVALAACGLVLCSYERAERLDVPLGAPDPALCAYNTDESQCETYHDSDEGSDCNVRRTESFRRAMQRYPSSRHVQRSGSLHSARCLHEHEHEREHERHARGHSMLNLSRKREMEAACDHLIMHLPPEPNYQVTKPMNTFYTIPRKTRNKSFSKHIRDDTSEITQNSDGFSLPPPPDEFSSYRAASRIRDVPAKATPAYTTINKTPKIPSRHNNDVIISPMNTVGLPTISGTQTVYSYPDDRGALSNVGLLTFQSFSSPKESGI